MEDSIVDKRDIISLLVFASLQWVDEESDFTNTMDRENSNALIVPQKEQHLLTSTVPFKIHVWRNVLHFFKSEQSAPVNCNEENKNKIHPRFS